MLNFTVKKKSLKIVGLLFLFALLLLTACSSNNNTSNEGKGEAKDKGKAKADGDATITLQVPDAEIWGAESASLQIMYDLYEQNNPNVKTEQVTVADINTALAAGSAPDLLLMSPYAAKENFKQGYVEPMNRYYESYGWADGMFEWAKNSFKLQEDILGIPWNYEGLILVYNQTMFDDNGWEIPENYNEIMSLIPQIQEQGIMPFAWGTADCEGCDNWWVTSIVNSVLGPEGTKQLFSGDKPWTDPVIVEGIQRYVDFWNAGYVTDKKSHAISQEDSMQLFYNSQAAMRLDGTWSLAAGVESDFEVAYTAFPSWSTEGKPVIPLGVGSGLVINANSEHKDEVAEMLSYFFHEDVVQGMAKSGVPEPIQADYSQMDIEPTISSALNLINEAADNGNTGYVSWSYVSPSVANVLDSDFASTYLKNVTVEEWLANLQKKKEKDVAEDTIFELENY